MNIKIGDKLAYVKYDVSNWQSSQIVGWGYVFHVNENQVGLARNQYGTTYIDLNSNCEKLFDISPEIKNLMKTLIEVEISNLKSSIKNLTHEEKEFLIRNEFDRIKQEITNVASNMINSENESQYINRLKEICQLKNKLFSIKVTDLENVHKSNGAIMYKIKKLQDLLKKIEETDFE